MKNHFSIVTTLGLVATALLSVLTLTGTKASANNDSITDDVEVTVPVACTMSGIDGTSHTATLTPGTFSGESGSEYESGIGKTTLTVKCNDNNGFSIYAIGFTGEEAGNNTLIGSTTSSTINTKAYEPTDTQSNWSMKVTKVDNPSQGDPVTYNPDNMTITNSFTSWHAVPNKHTQVAEYKSTTGPATTDTVLGAKVETTYAAFVSQNQPADTYTGKVKYTMVHPYTGPAPFEPTAVDCEAGKICYNTNAPAGAVEGTMGRQGLEKAKDWSQCSFTDNTTYCYTLSLDQIDLATLPELDYYAPTLLASNYSRTGYGFAGWSDVPDYTTNQNAHFYGPNETITVPNDIAENGLSLYAVWIKSQGSLQDSSKVSSVCNTLTTAPTDGAANLSSVSAFTDSRDNNTYAVARLADGRCWMIENLRLESTAQHNSDGILAQGYNSSFAGLADAESANFADSTTANSLYSTDGTTIKTINGTGGEFPRYNNWNNQINSQNRPQYPTTNLDINSATNAGMYSYGNYYTWHAAIADTTQYSNDDHDTTSICPIGWKIPLGDVSNGDIDQGAADTANRVGGFSYLDRRMGGSGQSTQYTFTDSMRWRKFPLNYIYSGDFDTSSANNRGTRGSYWSSTASYNSISPNYRYLGYVLSLEGSNVTPGASYASVYIGYSVRCTADI